MPILILSFKPLLELPIGLPPCGRCDLWNTFSDYLLSVGDPKGGPLTKKAFQADAYNEGLTALILIKGTMSKLNSAT